MENRETENAYFSEDESCYHYCHGNNDNSNRHENRASTATAFSPPGEENARRDIASTCNASQERQRPVGRVAEAQEERLVDVAVIGNGPSAIFLSLLLSGYKPYFNGVHPSSILSAKLKENRSQSLLEQDLQYLSEGLEGRSQNPVSLLFDTLYHPSADIGEFHPSCLSWEHDPSLKCSHVVIGRERPGGIWHQSLKSTVTLSLTRWLELPMFSFADWRKERDELSVYDRTLPQGASAFLPAGKRSTGKDYLRASVEDVADYYASYVRKLGLVDGFVSGTVVTDVEKLERCHGQSPDYQLLSPFCSGSDWSSVSDDPPCPRFFLDGEDYGICCQSEELFRDDQCYRWKLTAKSVCSGMETVVRSKKLVLACGLNKPKLLCIPGESQQFVIHSLLTFQDQIEDIRATGKPIVIVGAGMSAADAILLALKHGIPLYHAFHQKANDPSLIFPKLPHEMYGEYHHVWRLMQGTVRSPLYSVLDQHRVLSFLPEGSCEVENMEKGTQKILPVSAAVIMIGRYADLDFLPDNVKATLTVKSGTEIDSKHNVVDVDPYSHQTVSCPDLYALGPLAGDNFVRFVLGSGLAAAQSLLGLAP